MDKFKEKVQSMTASEIIEAMVRGLEKRHVKLSMWSFGYTDEGVCFGCAATNTICEISGEVFTPDSIGSEKRRAKFLGTNWRFLEGFELAINFLREGVVDGYNDIAKTEGFAVIKNNRKVLLYLGSDFNESKLDAYRHLADYNKKFEVKSA